MKALVGSILLLVVAVLSYFFLFRNPEPRLEKIETLVASTDSSVWATPSIGKGGALAYSSLTEPGVFVELPGGEKWKAWEGRLGERLLAWSPDGRYVAFRAESQPELVPRLFALVVAEPRVKAVEIIADYMPGLGRPQWRLAGKKMEVYASAPAGLVRREYDCEISGPEKTPWVYEKDGEIWLEGMDELPKQISRGGGYAPALSPDGTRVLYQWGDGIFIADAADPPSEDRKMTARGSAAAWAPDGRSIAYVRSVDKGHDETMEADIFILDLSREKPRESRITETPGEIEMELAWPEKGRIVFSVRNDGTIRSAEIK